jgi:hypothetical protein
MFDLHNQTQLIEKGKFILNINTTTNVTTKSTNIICSKGKKCSRENKNTRGEGDETL